MKSIALCIAVLAAAPLMHAQYVTTWVASYGNDANSCLRTGPCRTFAAAYIKTDSKGTIRAVDNADYGPVTISKPITIDGGDSGAFILGLSGNAIIITPGQEDEVNIRNLTIHMYAPYTAIVVHLGGLSLVNLENVAVTSHADASAGIFAGANGPLSATDARLNLRNVSVAGTFLGVVMKAGRLTTERLWISSRSTGLDLSGNTLQAVVRDSAFHTTNNGDGIHISTDKDTQNPMTVTIQRSEMSQNATGLYIIQYPPGPAITVHVSDSLITANYWGLRFFGPAKVFSFRNNVLVGNISDEPVLPSDSFK